MSRAAGREPGPPRRAVRSRAVRLAGAILLVLLVVLAIGVLRRDSARPGPSVTVKAPPAPAAGNGPPTPASPPAAAQASSPAAADAVEAASPGTDDGAGADGPGERGEGIPRAGVGEPDGRSAEGGPGGGPPDGGATGARRDGTQPAIRPTAPAPAAAGRVAPFRPIVLDGGEMRLFLAGIVSVPVVIPDAKSRSVVDLASEGSPAEVTIAAAAGGAATVSVVSGTVAIASGGRRVRVGAGTFTTVTRGVPPARPRALPPSPPRRVSGGFP